MFLLTPADAAPYIFGGIGLVALLALLLTSIFWIWMLVDSSTNPGLDGTERIIWVLVIFFTHVLGAVLYLLLARGKRGGGAPRIPA